MYKSIRFAFVGVSSASSYLRGWSILLWILQVCNIQHVIHFRVYSRLNSEGLRGGNHSRNNHRYHFYHSSLNFWPTLHLKIKGQVSACLIISQEIENMYILNFKCPQNHWSRWNMWRYLCRPSLNLSPPVSWTEQNESKAMSHMNWAWGSLYPSWSKSHPCLYLIAAKATPPSPFISYTLCLLDIFGHSVRSIWAVWYLLQSLLSCSFNCDVDDKISIVRDLMLDIESSANR